jgi:photosystem II stability/assembly factor-like uncharacterized protein
MKRRSALAALVGMTCAVGVGIPAVHAQWTQTSGPQGAVVTALAANERHIYAGVYDDIYHYDGATDRWVRTGSISGYGPLQSSFSTTRFLVVGDELIGSTRDGVIRSDDGGANWTFDAITGPLFTDGRDAYVLRDETVYRYTPAVGSWTSVGSVPPMTAPPTLFGQKAFTTTLYSNEIFQSSDGMRTWRQIHPELPLRGREMTAGMAVTFAAGGQYLYANVGGAEILRSRDGETWENISDDLPEWLGARDMYADDDELCIVTGQGVFRFDGSRWTQLATSPVREIAFAGDWTLLSTYGGVRVLAADGEHTTPFNGGLNSGGAFALTSIGTYVIASTSDGLYRTTDRGASWTHVADVSTWMQASYAELDGTLFTAAGALYRSSDSGASWTMIGPEYDFDWEGPPYRSDITGVAADDDAVYVGAGSYLSGKGASGWASGGIFASNDNGITWREISNNLPHDGFTYVPVGNVSARGGYLLITTARGVYRSSDGGARWSRAMNGLPLDDEYIGHAELIPRGDHHYLRLGTRFYESADGGLTWRPMSAPMPEGITWSGYATSSVDDRLYVIASAIIDDTTYAQRLMRFDGESWEDITTTQPPSVQFQSFVRAGDYIYAGSIRHGVWVSHSAATPSSVALGDASVLRGVHVAPLPAVDEVSVSYSLTRASTVALRVIDARGDLVRRIDLGVVDAGDHATRIRLEHLAAGPYIVQIVADDATKTISIVKAR